MFGIPEVGPPSIPGPEPPWRAESPFRLPRLRCGMPGPGARMHPLMTGVTRNPRHLRSTNDTTGLEVLDHPNRKETLRLQRCRIAFPNTACRDLLVVQSPERRAKQQRRWSCSEDVPEEPWFPRHRHGAEVPGTSSGDI